MSADPRLGRTVERGALTMTFIALTLGLMAEQALLGTFEGFFAMVVGCPFRLDVEFLDRLHVNLDRQPGEFGAFTRRVTQLTLSQLMTRLRAGRLTCSRNHARMLGAPLLPVFVQHVVTVKTLLGRLGPNVATIGDTHSTERHLFVLVDVGLKMRSPLVALNAIARLTCNPEMRRVRNAIRPIEFGAPIICVTRKTRLTRRWLESEETGDGVIGNHEARVEVRNESESILERLRFVTRAAANTLVGRIPEIHVASLEQMVAGKELRSRRGDERH